MSSVREYCYRCFRPKARCLCSLIPLVDNQTHVLVLQHKCERGHPFGTARFARLGLANAEVRVVWPDARRKFTARPIVEEGLGLLYPGPNAVDLESLAPGERPTRLVVLDGTWDDAKGLYRDNPWLANLPQYCLRPSSPSIYRIRREPSETSVSTLEAILLALSILEPSTTGLDSLLNAFDKMVAEQISCAQTRPACGATHRFQRLRLREPRAVPREVLEQGDDLVVAYAESVPWQARRRALVSLTAIRLGDNAVFEEFLEPPADAPLTSDHIELMGLTRENFPGAVDAATLRHRWSGFSKPSDVLVTWNVSTLAMVRETLGHRGQSLFLKAPYANTTRHKCGHLDDVAQRQNLELFPLPLQGRAAKRVAQAIAVVGFLQRLRS
jgi:DTW domain-containing protein YfiP